MTNDHVCMAKKLTQEILGSNFASALNALVGLW